MHPILVVNWIDWISYINSSIETLNDLTNFKSVLKSFESENTKRKKNINLLNNQTSSNRNQKRKLELTYLVSLVIPLVYLIVNLVSIIKRKLCFHYIFMLILLIVLDYFIRINFVVVVSATAAINYELDSKEKDQLDKASFSTLSLHNTLTSKLDKLDIFTNRTIQINSLSFKNTTNSIRNNGSHSKRNQSRTVRSIKLTNHRLKHRRSSLDSSKSYQNAKHLTSSATKTNNWSVLGDQEAEYALKLLESEHLTSAILHFIEITYKYSELNLPELQQQNDLNDSNSTADNKKSTNKYYNTGSCVQVKLDSLKGLLKSKSFNKYSKQAETARRTASLLTTLLTERLELPNDRNFMKAHFSSYNDTSSNIVLHKAFFWSLLKVNLQSDPNLFANGIIFRPDVNEFPIKLSIQSKKGGDEDEDAKEINNSTNKPFCPYIFRNKPNIFTAKNQKVDESSNNTSNESTNKNQTSQFSYVNLSGLRSFEQRIVPNPNAVRSSDTSNVQDSLQEKANNLLNLRDSLYNKKQSDPYSNTYSYSSDWYLHHANKYLNQPLNYHELTRSHLSINSTDQGFWTVPYLDCSTTRTWLISFSVPFFGLAKSANQIEFKGVVLISIDLSSEDINQCSDDDPFFPNSHKCDRETSECVPIKGLGFRRGAYACVCKSSFYIPNVTYSSASIKGKTISNQTSSFDDSQIERHFFNGTAVENAFIDTHVGLPKHQAPLFPAHFQCMPCPKDCEECKSNQSCKVSYASMIRVCVLGVQSFCATIVVILSATTFRLRRSKSFASSRWIILEALLFGALLMQFSVIIQYFEPKPLFCFLEPWLRELSFGFVYGSIIIKLYRIYAEFQTRKAHRVCVRDKDLLKYLCAIILVITGYMSAWSALILETINGFSNLTTQSAEVYIIQIGRTVDNLKFYLCKPLSWDYITQLGELSFILTGIYLSYCIRNARSEFYREKWALCTCIYIEFIVSGSFYILRHFLWTSLHPDLIYLMLFIRCQLTVTIVLALIFLPKLFCQNRPPQLPSSSGSTRKSRFFSGNEQINRVPEAMKLHAAVLSNGEIDVSDINLSEMDPEDIRSELRRVYTQLQVFKNKTIRKDNPHISKRRGGRKTHTRRFSLQAFNAHNKHPHKSSHHHHQDHEQEITEVSRTPEESTASLEGPSQVIYADGLSSVLSSK